MSEGLKSCPLCGGKAEIISKPSRSSFEQYEPSSHAEVGCKICHLFLVIKIWAYSPDDYKSALPDAIAAWNHRVPDPLAKRLTAFLEDGIMNCNTLINSNTLSFSELKMTRATLQALYDVCHFLKVEGGNE